LFDHLKHLLTRFGIMTSHPSAFIIALLYVVVWLAVSPKTLDWQGIATVATWFMTLFIQRAEHRDTQAIHAKLDELLRVDGGARSELAGMDTKEPEEIEKHRKFEAAKLAAG
jgi:low affinity Fe/Cu permease